MTTFAHQLTPLFVDFTWDLGLVLFQTVLSFFNFIDSKRKDTSCLNYGLEAIRFLPKASKALMKKKTSMAGQFSVCFKELGVQFVFTTVIVQQFVLWLLLLLNPCKGKWYMTTVAMLWKGQRLVLTSIPTCCCSCWRACKATGSWDRKNAIASCNNKNCFLILFLLSMNSKRSRPKCSTSTLKCCCQCQGTMPDRMEEKKEKKKGGFHKIYTLAPPMHCPAPTPSHGDPTGCFLETAWTFLKL